MSNGVMIGLLPITNDWCKIEVPHMTLVYAGKTDDLPATAFNDVAKDASSLALICNPLYLRVTGVATFGKGNDDDPLVDVFTLLPSPELWAMRRAVEKWNASEFPFKPHVTIGPTGGYIENRPMSLAFDRVCVGWGDEYLTFNMRR